MIEIEIHFIGYFIIPSKKGYCHKKAGARWNQKSQLSHFHIFKKKKVKTCIIIIMKLSGYLQLENKIIIGS